MKNILLKTTALTLLLLIAGFSLSAQEEKKEESKMVVKVLKEGKTVLDTTYLMDEDFDKKKIEAMIEGLDGDSKTIDILKFGDKDELHYDIIKKIGDVDGEGESVIMIKKMVDGKECEDVEVETKVEVIVDGKEGLHEFHTKEGNVMFFGDEKHHKMKSGNVFINKGDEGENVVIKIESDGKNTWTTKEGNVVLKKHGGEGTIWTTDENEVIDLSELKDKKGNMMFFAKEKKGQISLDLREDGSYRLGFDSDQLEPIQIEVFDSEGNKLFKKKVKNFYGRFLKDIDLGSNETGLFTVRVLQGEKEIIGEFEYK